MSGDPVTIATNMVHDQYHLPATVDDLQNLATLHFGTGWVLAATVYAWTEDHNGRPSKSAGKYALSQFTRLGIHGLTDRATVAKYRGAWQAAIEAEIRQFREALGQDDTEA